MADTLTPEELEKQVVQHEELKAQIKKLETQKDKLSHAIIGTLKVTGEKLTGGNLSQKLPSGKIVIAEHKSRVDAIEDKTIPYLKAKGAIYITAAMNRDEVNAAIKEGRITAAEVDEFFKSKEFYQVKSYG